MISPHVLLRSEEQIRADVHQVLTVAPDHRRDDEVYCNSIVINYACPVG